MGKNYNLKLRTLKLRNKIEIQFNTKITLIMNEIGLRKTRGIVHYIWDFIKIFLSFSIMTLYVCIFGIFFLQNPFGFC
jgi:hypothetical protein